MTKQAIANTFSKAALSYDDAAHLQRRVADRLLALTGERSLAPAPVIADLGTGTGYCLPALVQRYCPMQLNALDLSPAMLEQAQWREPTAIPVRGDLEALPFDTASHHLLISSLAVQWLDQPDAFLAEARRVLKTGGRLAISTLTDGTLHELKQAWRAADTSPHVNDCLPAEDWRQALAESGFQIEQWQSERIEVGYPSPLDLLQELKRLGANHVKARQGHVSRKALGQMLRAYQPFQRPDGQYPASWQVLYLVLRKTVN
ncbi:malonyl-ACP O-methyltransferase BioC [Saccharospirillum salsuginis]|uniref:Malonyl-[acyl-carrier protein] O-methyltransferase n=1 Tax=Saccharospirillum salsuginis TaxID=418750 RepID=A0A918K9M6_9GAMM|nr:malonyl-ACP O-methyltransferase BioC [Saccharospirillum salsuginis]GGX55914.1 malonyl-[acyl-carrier protein] O-methyltransferase [Saccharospirillum salsuginis]